MISTSNIARSTNRVIMMVAPSTSRYRCDVFINQNSSMKEGNRLGWPVVLMSIIGFWLFYVAIVTLRAYVLDLPSLHELAIRRLYVALTGIGITFIVWTLLRPFDNGRLPLRIAAVAMVCVPASFAVALVNDYFFTVYDQASLIEMDVIIPNGDYDHLTRIVEVAIWSYFFLIAWSALYLAIGYAQTVRTAERRAASFERAAQLAELRALRYQLNPHFLFNTLNSLSALVLSGRREAAESMILNLSTFYRTSLTGDPSGDVSLADEIALQKLYLDIEQVRFPDRLKVMIDVPDALVDHKVPGLILQPLVENAIKHGVARTTHPVEVRISARREGDMLLLEVSDDAPLVPSENGNGIGLANVLERLMARYGATATLQTTLREEGGYRAILTLPSPERTLV